MGKQGEKRITITKDEEYEEMVNTGDKIVHRANMIKTDANSKITTWL